MQCVKTKENSYSASRNVVLSYHDSIVRSSDIDLLCGPFWLNDTIIGFYLEYLEREKYNNIDICFIRPEILQCVKFTDGSELDVFLGPLGFNEKKFAVMPLNNCEIPDRTGGSHWSVLIYSKNDSCFYHIDSMSGTNDTAAKNMSRILSTYLKIPYRMDTLPASQQGNSYDCGVYVLRYCEMILKHISESGKINGVKLSDSFDVGKKRKEVRQLIENLAK